MDSFGIPSAIFRLFLLILHIPFPLSSSFSLPLKELAKGKAYGFKAPLIHWSSPESPFYEPNLTPGELMRASVRTSRARGDRIRKIRSSGISNSRKYPVSRISIIDKVYVMKFNIGSPPVETYAIPDTGSNIVWIQCGSPICTNCYKQKIPLFNPTKSSTYAIRLCGHRECKQALWGLGEYLGCKSSVQVCRYHISYEDHSFSEGTISTDIITFPEHIAEFGNYSLRMFFGCGYNNSETPGQDPNSFTAPGVVGLGNEMASLVGQLTLGQFSYCISTPDVQKPNGTIEIRFGLAASISGHSTALANNLEGWYIFQNVDGIYVDDTKVKGYPEWVFQFAEGGIGGLIMDSGTTYTELYFSALDALIGELKEQIELAPDTQDHSNSNYSLCYNAANFLLTYVPAIELKFTDNKEAYFPFTLRNAWIDNGNDQYCLAMFGTSGISIIGIYQHRDIKIGYDLKYNLVSFTEMFGCF
ncbi:probable aspartic protease At2g35615 [Ricinus communis]|uniref:Aspartic-type endopeptidase, putative n=1 Tax=Ricinus communis TaxID=3988 RepID=B9SL71_RICCO|nr:probable aspartic protease At2g35615 [Ricinus communis]EEF35654.1 aspartic-type endopeptidase, putative [Ricinus communis]|eukprot:XP_002526740.1 probable aspartic protease At2g35615 [Ricinus communis]